MSAPRFKLKCHEPVSNFAFNFNMRRYSKVMQESLQESEEEKAKREAEDSQRKRDDPAAYFQGSSFLQHLVGPCRLNPG